MPGRDIRNKLVPKILMNSAIASDTNTDSIQLDVADYDGGVKLNVFSTIYADGDYALEIHASDTDSFSPSSSTLLSGNNLIPASASVSVGAAAVLGAVLDSVGFITAKRYVVARIVSTNFSASGATIIITAENNPEIKPGV